MTIKELAQRARGINISNLKRMAVKNKENLLVDLQRKQIRQGVDGGGRRLIPLYPVGYGNYKSTLSTYNAPAGVPDLFLSGRWSKGIRMRLSGDDYSFNSTDGKDDKLTSKYEPYGLNDTTLPQAQTVVTLEFDQLAAKELGLI